MGSAFTPAASEWVNAYTTPGASTSAATIPTAVASGLGIPPLVGRSGTLIARFTF